MLSVTGPWHAAGMPHVTLMPSRTQFQVEPGESVLAAAQRAGLNLPHSCRGGNCAACMARVLSGRFAYRAAQPAGITVEEVRSGYALLCQVQALTDLVVETREVRPALEVEFKNLPCRIAVLEQLAPTIMRVGLRLPAVEEFNFIAGQYVDILPGDGRRRSFSIASAPADGAVLELHVQRASQTGFTAQLFDSLRVGALLRIEGPLGHLRFQRDSPRPAILVAGGTGYAPLRAMLRQLLAEGDRRPLTLYWGARTRQETYEDGWLRELARTRPAFVYQPVLANADEPGFAAGRVDEILLRDHPALGGFDIYTAGPPAMVDAVRSACATRGLPPAQLRYDSFASAADQVAGVGQSREQ
jgi:CDP-4-dehydro-6-deoxyglucose reductase